MDCLKGRKLPDRPYNTPMPRTLLFILILMVFPFSIGGCASDQKTKADFAKLHSITNRMTKIESGEELYEFVKEDVAQWQTDPG